MTFEDYIKPELLVLVPVLFLIGEAITKSEIKCKFIPFLLGGISIVLCALWIFATSETATRGEIATAIFTAITQGVLIAGASVYFDQLLKQAKKEV